MVRRYPYLATSSVSPDYYIFMNLTFPNPIRSNNMQRNIRLNEVIEQGKIIVHRQKGGEAVHVVVRKTWIRNESLCHNYLILLGSMLSTRVKLVVGVIFLWLCLHLTSSDSL